MGHVLQTTDSFRGSRKAPSLDYLDILLRHAHRLDSDNEQVNGVNFGAFATCSVPSTLHAQVPRKAHALGADSAAEESQSQEWEELAQLSAETSNQAHLTSKPTLSQPLAILQAKTGA